MQPVNEREQGPSLLGEPCIQSGLNPVFTKTGALRISVPLVMIYVMETLCC